MLEVGALRPQHGAPDSMGVPAPDLVPAPQALHWHHPQVTCMLPSLPISSPVGEATRSLILLASRRPRWPMYQKYKREMEANGVEVGKSLSEMRLAPPPPGLGGKPRRPSSSLASSLLLWGPDAGLSQLPNSVGPLPPDPAVCQPCCELVGSSPRIRPLG